MLLAVFIIATCGLIYELIAGTVASYVLGDSVMQFSTVIGVYMFAMGIGSWLSRFIERDVVRRFVELEIAVALIGGMSAAVLFLGFAKLEWFRVLLYSLVLVIGTLVGLEIPLLMRIMKDRYDLRELVARVLTADYLGALLASVAFPLFVVPKLGLVRGSLFVGVLNAIVALACTRMFRGSFTRPRQEWFLRLEGLAVLGVLVAGLVYGDRFTSLAEDATYADPIVTAKTSSYQRIVVTEGKGGFSLFINGNLQFASADEHRYHEALVHPVMTLARTSSLARSRDGLRVLILGGGDGLALREVLKYRDVVAATLVDLDPMMTELARTLPLLARQNRRALEDPRVTVVNDDAMVWIAEAGASTTWDVIIVDFPDPSSFTLGKLYTTRFYGLVAPRLAPGGAMVVQATSPLLARRSFWCVAETIEASGFFVRAYHAAVPSFGEWGYLLAAKAPFDVPSGLAADVPLAFLDEPTLASMFLFPKDMERVPADVNRLNNQALVQYYEEEWSRWN
ncbi:polyamine aminopropyltransferase [Myxococcota bacterium]|nr:polyamine aminopropyltransferase [Myxococcota bacterium]